MKTISNTNQGFPLQFSRILKPVFLSVTLLILTAVQGFTQGKLTGFIVDDEFNEPLEKAVVTIPGTKISVLTDQQGKYTLTLVGGDYFLEVNHPGYFGKSYNMSVTDEINTPMFIIKLTAHETGRTLQRRLTSFENKRQFPPSIENSSTWQTTEQTGHQEFNDLFRANPSVNLFSNGSGFSDSEIGFRGNEPNRTSYTFNGILLNNPETGRMGSSMLPGLTDWAGQIQVVSGQAANGHSQTSSGGLINVLSFLPHEKAGADLLAIYGNEGFLKTTATVHSGLSKNGFASSVQLSRTSGDGLTQNAGFEQYGFFLNIHKEFNHRNTLVLNVTGILQQHDRNRTDSIGAFNQYGTRYNPDWGKLDDKPLSWSTNYGRSPLISLTHFWQPRIKTYVTTQIYAQFNRSAQLNPGGSLVPVSPRETSGLILFDQITDWNKGLDVSEMGVVRQADENGKFINSETSGISTLAAIDRENRFGLRSVVLHHFTKKMELSSSFDFEHYQASHFGAVRDLLGADGYTSFSDLNRPDGFAVENLFQSKFFPSYHLPDPTSYSYESAIQTGGLSFRLNYEFSRFFWYLEGSASLRNLLRTDHFNYLSTDEEKKSGTTLLPGGRIQTGIRVNFWKFHSIHLRTGYGSYQPLFATLFPSGTNWKNPQANNEQVFDAEVGYTIFSRRLKVEALVYLTIINNRSTIRRTNLTAGDSFGLVNDLNELHQGVELKTSYKLTKNFQLNVNGSLGDWTYTKDATAQIYKADRTLTSENELLLKKVRIANAPQFSLFAEAEYRWAHNFYLRLNYSRADRIYAPFGLDDFKDLTDRKDFEQWRLPAFELVGVSGNYLIKVGKSQTLNLIFGANNILDTEYIEQSLTNIQEGNSRYTSNQVYYGTGRTWFAGIKFQF